MPRESIWIALWRINRPLPVLVGILLSLNLVAAGVALWYVGPHQARLEADFVQQQQSYREARATDQFDASPQGIFRQGLVDLHTLSGEIPDIDKFTGLLEDLFAMARKTNLAIDQVTYNPSPVKGEDLVSYSLAFAVSGDYGQVKKFIYLIEHSPRLVAIEALTLNSAGARTPGEINLGLNLTTYFRTGAP